MRVTQEIDQPTDTLGMVEQAKSHNEAGLPQSFIVDDKGQILLHIRGKVAGEKLNKISRLLLAAEGAR